MTDRHFVVVGGSRGIGRALATRLLQDGACVSCFARHATIEIDSPQLVQYVVDVTDANALRSAIDASVGKFGKITSIAFLQRNRGTDADFEIDLAVGLGATREVIEHVVNEDYFVDTSRNPSIVLVSSIADHFVAPEQPVGYHVAKAGLAQMGRYYALTLGPKGIRVNTVSPCVVIKDEAREFYAEQRRLMDRFQRSIPLGRAGRPDDIASVILFLASKGAAYVTGQNLVVDGGLTLRSHESILRDLA